LSFDIHAFSWRGWGARPPLLGFSIDSNIPKLLDNSSRKKLAAWKNHFVILDLEREPSNRDQTSHLHRAISQHRAARLGFHQRPAARQIRFVFHRSLAVRG